MHEARAWDLRSEELREVARLGEGAVFGEALTVLIVIGCLTWFALRAGGLAIAHTKALEAIFMSTGPRVAWTERWAFGGDLPPHPRRATPPFALGEVGGLSVNTPDGSPTTYRYVRDYVPGTGDGAFGFTMQDRGSPLDGQVIGFRPAFGPGEIPATVVWVCGHRQAPTGMSLVGADRTTVTNAYLPSGCRGR